jgi:hypothetical protein
MATGDSLKKGPVNGVLADLLGRGAGPMGILVLLGCADWADGADFLPVAEADFFWGGALD